MDETHLGQGSPASGAEAAKPSELGPPASSSGAGLGKLGTLRIHGLGIVQAFVITETDLEQLFAESELARDAAGWFFCSLGVFSSAAVTLATFAPTAADFTWRYTVVYTVTAISLILSLKTYVAWRKHAGCYRKLEHRLRTRDVSAVVAFHLPAEAHRQIRRVER